LAIPPLVNPYPKGIKLMSAREADEEARHGEVLRWSSDDEETKDSNADKNNALDKTPSLPDILKSPEPIQARIPGSVVVDGIGSFDIESRRVGTVKDKVARKKNFKGVNFVPETEQQNETSESDDDVPVAQLLKPRKTGCLTKEMIDECKEGPEGDKAVGKTVAKIFDGVTYTGIVDGLRTERKRSIYHVTYSDGDEEEWTERELRDGFLLGLAPEITAQWKTLKKTGQIKDGEDTEASLEEEASDGGTSSPLHTHFLRLSGPTNPY
jgi:hypothetical protein